MSQPAKSSVDSPRSGRQAENMQMPVDLLGTVRLPPPTVSNAYAWGGSTGSGGRAPLADNTNMLRTPESIMRFNELGALKRAAEMPGDEPMKQRKLRGPIANTVMRNDRKSLESPMNILSSGTMPGGPGGGQYERQYYEQERFLERPNSDLGGSIPHFNASKSPVYAPRGRLMLSPSASPYDRKAEGPNMELMHTPTRGERPASTPDLTYDQRMFLLQRRMPSLPMMPPIPPPPASLTSSAVPPMPTAASTYQPRPTPPYPYQNSENYVPSYTGSNPGASHMKHVEIPPPDLMPKIEDDGKKPTYSYAMLIGMAILRAPERKLTLSQIYNWIMDTFEFYRNSKPTWHNSIRHNLSLNKAFEKQVRPKGDSGKGNYWTIVKGLEYQFMKPRPAKRGSDGLMQQPQTQQPLVEHNQNVNVSARTSQAGLNVESIAFASPADTSVHDGRHSAQINDAIPSDATEPDERILEEESKSLHSGQSFVKPNTKIEEAPGRQLGHPPSLTYGGGPLPQLHTMSSSSSSRPHSPSIVSTSSDLSLSSQGIPRSASSIASRGQLDTHAGYSQEHNEWHGQGQFAFRCSTPSMLSAGTQDSPFVSAGRLSFDPSTTLSVQSPEMIQHNAVSPTRGHALSNDDTKSSDQLTVVKPSECEWKASAASTACPPIRVTSLAHAGSHSHEANDEHHVPKTPEKTPKVSSDTTLSSSKSKRLVPIMNPPKSFESPYAGTLELSPGIAHAGEHGGGGTGDSSSRPFYRRHHRKKSSLNNLSDYLELDLRKVDRASGHHRSNSDSSDDTNTNAGGSHLTSSGLNTNSHMGSLALSFDIDLSPHVVVTPIRRPFDTPIRDQAQAYSPYCCRSTSNFGSPLRKS